MGQPLLLNKKQEIRATERDWKTKRYFEAEYSKQKEYIFFKLTFRTNELECNLNAILRD